MLSQYGFWDGNPTVGFSKQKKGIRLIFRSGADFDEEKLNIKGAKFKDASIFYNDVTEINTTDLMGWFQNQDKSNGTIKSNKKKRKIRKN